MDEPNSTNNYWEDWIGQSKRVDIHQFIIISCIFYSVDVMEAFAYMGFALDPVIYKLQFFVESERIDGIATKSFKLGRNSRIDDAMTIRYFYLLISVFIEPAYTFVYCSFH